MNIATPQKVALVTGGRGGIGQAICNSLAQEGHHVVSLDLDAAAPESSGDAITQLQADITRDGDVADAVALAVSRGSLTAVVNCAGILRNLFVDTPPDAQISQLWEVNVAAMARVCHFAVPHMPQGSAIVNIGSVSCRLGRWSAGASMYAATKAGVETYSRYLACELAPSGIRVNAVVPGLIAVPMSDAMKAVTGGEEASAHLVPMNRYGTAEEIADAVEFLLSRKASYITGTTLVVDGGVTIA